MNRTNKGTKRGRMIALLASTVMVSVAGAGLPLRPAVAQEAARVYDFNIPAKPIRAAMNDIVRVSGIDVVFAETPAASAMGNPVRGSLTPSQAVATLLSGTGVTYGFTDSNTVTISATGERLGAVDDGSVLLDSIIVRTQGATTEGTGSYTTTQMNTATPLGLSIRETPQSVSVVTQQKIEDKNYQTLEEALLDTPGITAFQGNTGDRWNYYARGQQISGILYDGLKYSSGSFTRDLTASDDMAVYDRVEVVRGATGLSQGTGNPSATINLVRKRPTAGNQSSVTVTGSSWGHGSILFDTSGQLNDDGSVRGRFVANAGAGDWYQDHNERSKLQFYGTVEADIGEATTVNLGVSYQKDREDGYAGGGFPVRADGSFYDLDPTDFLGADWNYLRKEATTVYFDLEHEFANDWTLEFTSQGKWSEGDLLTYYHYPDSMGNLTYNPRRWWGDDRQFSADCVTSAPMGQLRAI
ncbi:TonB-dependent siderophore receptor [Celeribacter indicus]|uniref:TonB-dependent outermembrane ferripyoverdine receptor FpvA n=1 Tax=Celeribacter indicus TaxID=1208324 RepID=A0A0B5E8J6_9RHOB|nr:TonB-dependent receptor [Celeribacter indicus]AJE48637.1 TonB-dependent outermembrane ferripyoverdine receptor FpvA [Celeribacter indicus]SDX34652.1 outer-membrane receptor for ferric coprogen and ferric-rhodotorulic acid [Celeribacter indicus]